VDTIYITSDPWRAEVAESAGVDRIMVDLEILGKPERQPFGNTVISGHSLSDVRRVRSSLNKALLLVRINPVHEQTRDEIRACIEEGADILMLPMFSNSAEVGTFVDSVDGRTRTCLLLETAAALARINEILDVGGVDEVHIGLNDLHLSLKLDFMFEILSGGLADYMAQIFRGRGIKFGIGGVARLGGGLLSAELVLSEHVRLGSTQVILSRNYGQIFKEYPPDAAAAVFRDEVTCLRKLVQHLSTLGQRELEATSMLFKREVTKIVSQATMQRQHRIAVQTVC
jgi:2-keto-3-deoxy-L-rhamnonate aldolase RhmA